MNLLLPVLLSSSVAALLPGADLASYRNFRLDTAVADVAKQTNLTASDTKLVSSRPARIEELDWHASWNSPAEAQSNPISEVLFRFYNGELFEMTVTYDRSQTHGLTDGDMIETISRLYGRAAGNVASEMSFISSGRNRITVKVVAGWDDAHNQVSLVHLPNGTGFGLVISSRTNKALAEQALAESDRLDRAEEPQRAPAGR
jgi:hypothetical protein